MTKIKKIEPKFETSDGSEFPTHKQAEAHERTLEAIRAFNIAREEFDKATASKRMTADGVLFDLGSWHEYYYVRNWHGREPYLISVRFWRDTAWRLTGSDNETLNIVVLDLAQKQFVEYEIGELYHARSNAEIKLIEEMEKYIADLQRQLDEKRKAVYG